MKQKDVDFILKMTKAMDTMAKRIDYLEDKISVIEKRDSKDRKDFDEWLAAEDRKEPVSPSAVVSNQSVFPKVEGDPHCIITSTFDLEGTEPITMVVNQNNAQMEMRQFVIDFCRKHKIIGMNVTFQEKK